MSLKPTCHELLKMLPECLSPVYCPHDSPCSVTPDSFFVLAKAASQRKLIHHFNTQGTIHHQLFLSCITQYRAHGEQTALKALVTNAVKSAQSTKS